MLKIVKKWKKVNFLMIFVKKFELKYILRKFDFLFTQTSCASGKLSKINLFKRLPLGVHLWYPY